jgi:hypothetical protein
MIHVVAFLAPSFWMNLPSRIIHKLREFRVNITIRQEGLCDHLRRKKFLTLTSYHFCISTPILKLEMTTFVVFTQLLTGRENSLSNAMVKIAYGVWGIAPNCSKQARKMIPCQNLKVRMEVQL